MEPEAASVPIAAYVDGFNLYNGMHDARGRRGLWLDLPRLLSSLLRADQSLVRVHYFTALVRGSGKARQQTFLDAATAHGAGVFVPHVGRFQQKTLICRVCKKTFTTLEEKESDVSLSVQMVEDAAAGLFDQALIVSGDSDMSPAVASVRRLRPGARLVAVFPPRRSSHQLAQMVDSTLQIFDRVPERFQMPGQVARDDGVIFERPDYWR